jgi:hypothetical protein
MTQTVSEKPWSDYSESDYSLEQWHNACLIHLHDGPPTSKTQCKLPIKTPAGVINKNGVSAALAALHGARAPLKAPADQKAKVERRLQALSSQFSSQKASSLEHHGVKGMKWGIRTKSLNKPSSGRRRTTSSDYRTTLPHRGKHPSTLTNKQLAAVNNRINLETNYARMNPSRVAKGRLIAKGLLGAAATGVTMYNLYNSPAGKAAVEAGRKLLQKK